MPAVVIDFGSDLHPLGPEAPTQHLFQLSRPKPGDLLKGVWEIVGLACVNFTSNIHSRPSRTAELSNFGEREKLRSRCMSKRGRERSRVAFRQGPRAARLSAPVR